MMPTERKLRKQLKLKRIEVLNKISELNSKHCVICPKFDKQSKKICWNCHVYKKIQVLGKELTNIANSKPREEAKFKGLEGDASNFRNAQIKLATFTPESYLQMKENGKLDKHICRRLGVCTTVFYEWKKAHGLVNKLGNGKLANFTEEDYVQLRSEGLSKADIARRIGVSRNSIYSWVKHNIK